jgi:hypothetical protein
MTLQQYKILPYSYKQAKILGVQIFPSENIKYKIKVIDKNNKVIYIGANGYMDYPNYLLKNKTLAEQKRINYKKRHEKYRHIQDSKSFYADRILW